MPPSPPPPSSALNVLTLRPARSLFHWMSDLTQLSPLRLVSAECLNSDLSKFDNFVYFTSLLFLGVCLLVWVTYYAHVRLLSPTQASKQEGEQATSEQATEPISHNNESNKKPVPKTRDQVYSEHMGLFLLITFLAYPNISKIQLESLDCSTEFDGKKYLR